MNFHEYAIIVAGGKGTRLKSVLPKQFLELNGLPVLMHTVRAFRRYSSTLQIILVLPEDDFDIWASLCQKHQFEVPVILQKGGLSRFQSVKKGLEKIQDEKGLVAIHDGVRPLVDENIIATSFRLAAKHQTAVASVSLKDSIRVMDGDGTKAMDRTRFKLIQTPQTFSLDLIKKAYLQEESAALTDDASVAERAGYSIFLFEGSYENLKITTSEDLVVAEALLKQKAGAQASFQG